MNPGEYLGYCPVKNTVKDRTEDDSLVHTFTSKLKLQKSTQILNKELKKIFGKQSYEQFLKCKQKVLKTIGEDAEVTEESDFSDDDYETFYSGLDYSKIKDSKIDNADSCFAWLYILKEDQPVTNESVDEPDVKTVEKVKASESSNSRVNKKKVLNSKNANESRKNNSKKNTTLRIDRSSKISQPFNDDSFDDFTITELQAQSTKIFSDTFSSTPNNKIRSNKNTFIKQIIKNAHEKVKHQESEKEYELELEEPVGIVSKDCDKEFAIKKSERKLRVKESVVLATKINCKKLIKSKKNLETSFTNENELEDSQSSYISNNSDGSKQSKSNTTSKDDSYIHEQCSQGNKSNHLNIEEPTDHSRNLNLMMETSVLSENIEKNLQETILLNNQSLNSQKNEISVSRINEVTDKHEQKNFEILAESQCESLSPTQTSSPKKRKKIDKLEKINSENLQKDKEETTTLDIIQPLQKINETNDPEERKGDEELTDTIVQNNISQTKDQSSSNNTDSEDDVLLNEKRKFEDMKKTHDKLLKIEDLIIKNNDKATRNKMLQNNEKTDEKQKNNLQNKNQKVHDKMDETNDTQFVRVESEKHDEPACSGEQTVEIEKNNAQPIHSIEKLDDHSKDFVIEDFNDCDSEIDIEDHKTSLPNGFPQLNTGNKIPLDITHISSKKNSLGNKSNDSSTYNTKGIDDLPLKKLNAHIEESNEEKLVQSSEEQNKTKIHHENKLESSLKHIEDFNEHHKMNTDDDFINIGLIKSANLQKKQANLEKNNNEDVRSSDKIDTFESDDKINSASNNADHKRNHIDKLDSNNTNENVIKETQESLNLQQNNLSSQEMFSSLEDLTTEVNINESGSSAKSESNNTEVPLPQKEISEKKITKIQELVEKENLLKISCESTLNYNDISDDEEVFILEVPKNAFSTSLIGETISSRNKTLKLGENTYETFLKKVPSSYCCILKSKKNTKYKALNIRPVLSIVTRRKKKFQNMNNACNIEDSKKLKKLWFNSEVENENFDFTNNTGFTSKEFDCLENQGENKIEGDGKQRKEKRKKGKNSNKNSLVPKTVEGVALDGYDGRSVNSNKTVKEVLKDDENQRHPKVSEDDRFHASTGQITKKKIKNKFSAESFARKNNNNQSKETVDTMDDTVEPLRQSGNFSGKTPLDTSSSEDDIVLTLEDLKSSPKKLKDMPEGDDKNDEKKIEMNTEMKRNELSESLSNCLGEMQEKNENKVSKKFKKNLSLSKKKEDVALKEDGSYDTKSTNSNETLKKVLEISNAEQKLTTQNNGHPKVLQMDGMATSKYKITKEKKNLKITKETKNKFSIQNFIKKNNRAIKTALNTGDTKKLSKKTVNSDRGKLLPTLGTEDDNVVPAKKLKNSVRKPKKKIKDVISDKNDEKIDQNTRFGSPSSDSDEQRKKNKVRSNENNIEFEKNSSVENESEAEVNDALVSKLKKVDEMDKNVDIDSEDVSLKTKKRLEKMKKLDLLNDDEDSDDNDEETLDLLEPLKKKRRVDKINSIKNQSNKKSPKKKTTENTGVNFLPLVKPKRSTKKNKNEIKDVSLDENNEKFGKNAHSESPLKYSDKQQKENEIKSENSKIKSSSFKNNKIESEKNLGLKNESAGEVNCSVFSKSKETGDVDVNVEIDSEDVSQKTKERLEKMKKLDLFHDDDDSDDNDNDDTDEKKSEIKKSSLKRKLSRIESSHQLMSENGSNNIINLSKSQDNCCTSETLVPSQKKRKVDKIKSVGNQSNKKSPKKRAAVTTDVKKLEQIIPTENLPNSSDEYLEKNKVKRKNSRKNLSLSKNQNNIESEKNFGLENESVREVEGAFFTNSKETDDVDVNIDIDSEDVSQKTKDRLGKMKKLDLFNDEDTDDDDDDEDIEKKLKLKKSLAVKSKNLKNLSENQDDCSTSDTLQPSKKKRKADKHNENKLIEGKSTKTSTKKKILEISDNTSSPLVKSKNLVKKPNKKIKDVPLDHKNEKVEQGACSEILSSFLDEPQKENSNTSISLSEKNRNIELESIPGLANSNINSSFELKLKKTDEVDTNVDIDSEDVSQNTKERLQKIKKLDLFNDDSEVDSDYNSARNFKKEKKLKKSLSLKKNTVQAKVHTNQPDKSSTNLEDDKEIISSQSQRKNKSKKTRENKLTMENNLVPVTSSNGKNTAAKKKRKRDNLVDEEDKSTQPKRKMTTQDSKQNKIKSTSANTKIKKNKGKPKAKIAEAATTQVLNIIRDTFNINNDSPGSSNSDLNKHPSHDTHQSQSKNRNRCSSTSSSDDEKIRRSFRIHSKNKSDGDENSTAHSSASIFVHKLPSDKLVNINLNSKDETNSEKRHFYFDE